MVDRSLTVAPMDIFSADAPKPIPPAPLPKPREMWFNPTLTKPRPLPENIPEELKAEETTKALVMPIQAPSKPSIRELQPPKDIRSAFSGDTYKALPIEGVTHAPLPTIPAPPVSVTEALKTVEPVEPVEPVETTEKKWSSVMKKDELLMIAKSKNLVIPEGATKGDLILLLKASDTVE